MNLENYGLWITLVYAEAYGGIGFTESTRRWYRAEEFSLERLKEDQVQFGLGAIVYQDAVSLDSEHPEAKRLLDIYEEYRKTLYD
jgi:hypothetical protein